MHKPGPAARSIAQALINRGLSAERPVVILSENDLEHASALGCMVAGVPFVPTSPPYSLISQDYDKLKHVLRPSRPAWCSRRCGALWQGHCRCCGRRRGSGLDRRALEGRATPFCRLAGHPGHGRKSTPPWPPQGPTRL
jgi:hypothetical protein